MVAFSVFSAFKIVLTRSEWLPEFVCVPSNTHTHTQTQTHTSDCSVYPSEGALLLYLLSRMIGSFWLCALPGQQITTQSEMCSREVP